MADSQGAENPLVVFISSVMDTSVDDLTAERRSAVETINALPITRSWAFEFSPASADPLDESYMDKVDECDIFLLILGTEITEPVRREYDRAVTLKKRRLVFVKDLPTRASEAAEWLAVRQDVKWERFHEHSDLAERVRRAVVDEVIKAHRRLNLREKDFEDLANKLRSEPVTFLVRTVEARELVEVGESFPELPDLYPDFEDWLTSKIVQINQGTAAAYVASYEQANAGFALTDDKGAGVRKLSTLYMKPGYRGLGVGERLLYGVIVQAAKDGIEKIYVTVSEERRDQLEELLLSFGFFVEGVSGRRYRPGSCSWTAESCLFACLRPLPPTIYDGQGGWPAAWMANCSMWACCRSKANSRLRQKLISMPWTLRALSFLCTSILDWTG
jgi:ribosomal protein S18 acetylase RimI-like enzyme